MLKRMIVTLVAGLLLLTAFVTIRPSADDNDDRFKPVEVVTMARGPVNHADPAGKLSQPAPVTRAVYASETLAETAPAVTAETLASQNKSEQAWLNSDAIIRVSDRPFPEDAAASDQVPLEEVLTSRGY